MFDPILACKDIRGIRDGHRQQPHDTHRHSEGVVPEHTLDLVGCQESPPRVIKGPGDENGSAWAIHHPDLMILPVLFSLQDRNFRMSSAYRADKNVN